MTYIVSFESNRQYNWTDFTITTPDELFENLYDYLDGSTIPHAVIIIGDYSYKSAFVADQEINMLACMTELMGAVKFK